MVLIIIIDSCSIEKRHYRNGFSIRWNNKSIDNPKGTPSVSTLRDDDSIKINDNLSASSEKEILPIINRNKINSISPIDTTTKKIKSKESKIKIHQDDKPTRKEERKKSFVRRKSRNAFVLGILSWSLIVLCAIVVSLTYVSAVSDFLALLLIFGLVVLSLGAIVLAFMASIQGARALIRIKKNPEEKKYKKRALIGFILGFVILFSIFAAIFFAINFT